jgi:hypothetical protein
MMAEPWNRHTVVHCVATEPMQNQGKEIHAGSPVG